MAFNIETLNSIYYRTSGYCHICRKKLAYKNYGIVGARGAWEVEHSKPRANGGTDHKNNLFPSCIPCNRSKGKKATRVVRKQHGHTKAPLSTEKRKSAKEDNSILGGLIGAVVGSIAGPIGALAVAAIGAKLGHSVNPDD